MRERNSCSRNGSLERVVGDGGPIQFQNTDHDISIGEDGTISVREGQSATSDSTRGQLQLAQFANPGALQFKDHTIFVCEVGERSAVASEMAVALGVNDVVNFRGGHKAWREAGLPLEKGL